MAVNQLSATTRYELQEWLKKVAKTGFADMHGIEGICGAASKELNRNISRSHIKNSALITNTVIPHMYSTGKYRITKSPKCAHICTCGKKYDIIIVERKEKVE